MILDKNITEEDIVSIKKFDSENLLDYIDDKFTFHKALVRNEHEVVTLGLLRVVTELKIIVNPNYSKLQVAYSINELFKESIRWSKQKGPNEIIIIVTKGGEQYEQFLKKNFGFENINGTPMKLEV